MGVALEFFFFIPVEGRVWAKGGHTEQLALGFALQTSLLVDGHRVEVSLGDGKPLLALTGVDVDFKTAFDVPINALAIP